MNDNNPSRLLFIQHGSFIYVIIVFFLLLFVSWPTISFSRGQTLHPDINFSTPKMSKVALRQQPCCCTAAAYQYSIAACSTAADITQQRTHLDDSSHAKHLSRVLVTAVNAIFLHYYVLTSDMMYEYSTLVLHNCFSLVFFFFVIDSILI